jgi:hypothetical protein
MSRKSLAIRAALLSLAVGAACGGKSEPATTPAPAPGENDLVTADEAASADEFTATRAADAHEMVDDSRPRLVGGHVDARYEFSVPPGLVRLRGILPKPGDDPAELSAAGPDGVGMPGQSPIAFDAIGVFSDPRGLGPDVSALPPADRDRLIGIYGDLLRERFPSATAPKLTTIGAHSAIRIDMPRIEMPDRPVRAGRHYLVLDGVATVSVDCMWTPENAERMSKGCDDVAASLRRHAP